MISGRAGQPLAVSCQGNRVNPIALILFSLKRRAAASSALGYAEMVRRGLNGPGGTIVFAIILGIISFTRFRWSVAPLPAEP